jgi:hypothetical protein
MPDATKAETEPHQIFKQFNRAKPDQGRAESQMTNEPPLTRTEKENAIINKVLDTLTSLSIDSTNIEQLALSVTLLRQRYDWKKFKGLGPDWEAAVDNMALQSWMMKLELAELIHDDKPEVIEALLKADLPFELPPMKDFIVRTNASAIFDEMETLSQ